MVSSVLLRQRRNIGAGCLFLVLMAGCVAPAASPAPAASAIPVPAATVEPAAPPVPGAPQIQVSDAWSRPALRMVAMPAETATPCPTPDLLSINPCEASGDPMPVCATPDTADAPHDMGEMVETGDMAEMTDMGTRGVVYLTLINQGNAPDRLIGIESAVAATAQLHQTTMDDAGIMRMRPVEGGLEIPAGGQVTLEPGSYHIMLADLSQDLALGDRFEVVLTFENSGPITTTAEVRLP